MNSFQPRQPKGRPIGGQWASHERSEAGIESLDDHGVNAWTRPLTRGADPARMSVLMAGGYAPAAIAFAVDDPNSTHAIDEWHDQHAVLAESGTDKAIPVMPDDYTPKMTGGRSFGNHRRTHRMNYTGDDVSIRMYSATAIRRYAAEAGGTFDVPFSAKDENSGKSVSGYARVTRTGPGSWSVTVPGSSGVTNAKISEGIAATLEGRRVTTAMRAKGDLLRAHAERKAAEGAPRVRLEGSWIANVGYNDADGLLAMETHSGKTYGYRADPEVYRELVSSGAPGRVFNARIKSKAERVGVASCNTCRAIYSEARKHSCSPDRIVKSKPARAANDILGRRARFLGGLGR